MANPASFPIMLASVAPRRQSSLVADRASRRRFSRNSPPSPKRAGLPEKGKRKRIPQPRELAGEMASIPAQRIRATPNRPDNACSHRSRDIIHLNLKQNPIPTEKGKEAPRPCHANAFSPLSPAVSNIVDSALPLLAPTSPASTLFPTTGLARRGASPTSPRPRREAPMTAKLSLILLTPRKY